VSAINRRAVDKNKKCPSLKEHTQTKRMHATEINSLKLTKRVELDERGKQVELDERGEAR
jgi:hypothetical protein